VVKEVNERYIPYDYAYTAVIPCDVHLDHHIKASDRLPENLLAALKPKESVLAKIKEGKRNKKETMKQTQQEPRKRKNNGEPEI
jgi:hypothetical protein